MYYNSHIRTDGWKTHIPIRKVVILESFSYIYEIKENGIQFIEKN